MAIQLCDKPLAAVGFISYRYRGQYGWIMIGAVDHADALREAAKATTLPVMSTRLQIWAIDEYVPVA
jgi:hypothetical protein